MTKPELEQRLEELEEQLSLVNEENSSLKETISKLEQEKRNLVSANSSNASKYVSAKDENLRLKKRLEELEQQPNSNNEQAKLLQEQLNKERQVSTKQLMALYNFTKRLLDQQSNTHNLNVQLFDFVVKDIESYK